MCELFILNYKRQKSIFLLKLTIECIACLWIHVRDILMVNVIKLFSKYFHSVFFTVSDKSKLFIWKLTIVYIVYLSFSLPLHCYFFKARRFNIWCNAINYAFEYECLTLLQFCHSSHIIRHSLRTRNSMKAVPELWYKGSMWRHRVVLVSFYGESHMPLVFFQHY